MNNKLQLAIWSVGEHARRNILPALPLTESVELIGTYTRNTNINQSVSREHGCKKYCSGEELLGDAQVQAVYISGPNSVHHTQIKQCLVANKSVLVEKTALTNLRDAEEIVALARSKNLVVMEAFMYRFHRQFHHLKDILISKKYGQIVRIQSEFGFPHLDPRNIRYKKELAGGALMDAGAYTLSSVRQLIGNNVDVIGATMLSNAQHEVDIKGFALLQSNDSIAQCSWVIGGSYINSINIWCEDAHIEVDRAFSKPAIYETSICVSANGKMIEQLATGKDNHFVNMLNVFSKTVIDENNFFELDELLQQAKLIDSVKKAAIS